MPKNDHASVKPLLHGSGPAKGPFGILEIGLLELSVRQNETRNSDFVSLQKLGVQKEVMIACKHR